MTACLHHLADDPTGSLCTRDAHPDHPLGHVYVSSDGSAVPDRHDATNGGEH